MYAYPYGEGVHVIILGSYKTVSEQVAPTATDPEQVVAETAAVPGEGVMVPDTEGVTVAPVKFNGKSP